MDNPRCQFSHVCCRVYSPSNGSDAEFLGLRSGVSGLFLAILVPEIGKRCLQYTAYRRTLNVLAKQQQQANLEERSHSQSHTNYRYLSSPDKVERLRKLHQLYRKTSKQLNQLAPVTTPVWQNFKRTPRLSE